MLLITRMLGPGDKELVHLNDYYFVSRVFFFCFHSYFVVFFFELLFPPLPSIYSFFQVRSNGIALPVSWGLVLPLKIMGAKQKESGN